MSTDLDKKSKRLFVLEKFRAMPKEIWVAFIGATATVLAAIIGLATLLYGTDRSPAPVPQGGLIVEYEHLQFTVKNFRDRAKGEEPIRQGMIQKPWDGSKEQLDIYDEFEIDIDYKLKPHTQPWMPIRFHTTGQVRPAVKFPTGTEHYSDSEEFDKTDGKATVLMVDLRKASGEFHDEVKVKGLFYNGLQKSEKGEGYESDGGAHVEFPVNKLTMVVDFREIDYERLVRGKPIVKLIPPKALKNEKYKDVASTWEGGVVTCSVDHPEVGWKLFCDWEWASEPVGK